MAGDFPTTGDAITPQWLTGVLREAGVLDDGQVSTIQRVGVDEQGQTGECVVLSLSYDGSCGDAPAALVAKVSPPHEEVRGQMHAMGLYEREVRFYQHLAADVGMPVPRSYFADITAETGEFLLLLEDLSACRNGDGWVTPLEDQHVAIDALAKMHSRWWCSPRIRETKWLPQHDDAAYNETLIAAVLRGVLPVAEQKYPEHLRGYLLECARKLTAQWESFAHHDEGDVFTLCHGDYHPKQLFFPTERDDRFAAFDWQTVASGRPGTDLARIVATGLTPAQMRDRSGELVSRYHEGLAAAGVQWERTRLDEAVRQGLLAALAVVVFAVATTDTAIIDAAASQRGMDWRQRMFTEFSEVLEDFGAIDLLDA